MGCIGIVGEQKLTYISTSRILYNAVDTKKLVERRPLRDVGEHQRSLYVTPEVAAGLDGQDERLMHLPMHEMESHIAAFIAGHVGIPVSLAGNDAAKPTFERLRNLDEVWAICARRPRMFQVRLLGRFLDERVFVGLKLYDRHFLGFSDRYHSLAAEIPALWSEIFGGRDPFRASAAVAYLGIGCRDVDEIQG